MGGELTEFFQAVEEPRQTIDVAIFQWLCQFLTIIPTISIVGYKDNVGFTD